MSPSTIPNSQQILLLWKNTARLDPIINLHSPIVNNCRCPIINVLSPVINLLKYQIHNKFCWRATAKLDPIINQHSPIIICRCPIINVRSPIINHRRWQYLLMWGVTGRARPSMILLICGGIDWSTVGQLRRCRLSFFPRTRFGCKLGVSKTGGMVHAVSLS